MPEPTDLLQWMPLLDPVGHLDDREDLPSPDQPVPRPDDADPDCLPDGLRVVQAVPAELVEPPWA
jgi:hypothetical protein